MKIIYTKHAKNALDDIYKWYKSVGAGKAGRIIRAAILKKSMLLKEQPFLGQKEDLLEELGLGHRYLVEGNYKIIYRVDTDIIIITDVFDSRQNPQKMKG